MSCPETIKVAIYARVTAYGERYPICHGVHPHSEYVEAMLMAQYVVHPTDPYEGVQILRSDAARMTSNCIFNIRTALR